MGTRQEPASKKCKLNLKDANYRNDYTSIGLLLNFPKSKPFPKAKLSGAFILHIEPKSVKDE